MAVLSVTFVEEYSETHRSWDAQVKFDSVLEWSAMASVALFALVSNAVSWLHAQRVDEYIFSKFHLGGSHANMFLFIEDGHFGHCLSKCVVWVLSHWQFLKRQVCFKALRVLESVICVISRRLAARVSAQPRFVGEKNDCVLHYSVKRATCQKV